MRRLSSFVAILTIHVLCVIAGTTPLWKKLSSQHIFSNIAQHYRNKHVGSGLIQAVAAELPNRTPVLERDNYRLYRVPIGSVELLVKVLPVDTAEAEKDASREIRLLKDSNQYFGVGMEKRNDCQQPDICLTYYIFMDDFGYTYPEVLKNVRIKLEIQKALIRESKPSHEDAVTTRLIQELTIAAAIAQWRCSAFRVTMDHNKMNDLNNYQFQAPFAGATLYDPGSRRIVANIINFSGGTGPDPGGRRVPHIVFPKESWTKA